MPLNLKRLVTCIALFALPCFSFAVDSEKESAHIVVTIKPLYSLVAHLTAGIEQPLLLMKQTQSAHHYNMRPSERRLLANAKMIIWIGPQMESYLSKVIQQQNTNVVSAMQANGLKIFQRRVRNNLSHTHKHADNVDPHIWLSFHNAIAISKHISQQLIQNDSENKSQYTKNLHQLTKKINQLASETKEKLKNSPQSFITYHDAFQYFEVENKLNYIDSINFDEEAGSSLKHISHIKTSINKNSIQCLLYQAPKPDIVKNLVAQANLNTAALDPLGQTINDHKNAWFEIISNTATSFKRCLNGHPVEQI